MVHGILREFHPKKESIEDFVERFEFYCLANGICGDNADRKKANFVKLLGQETLAKLKTLASPTAVSELTLDSIKQHLNNYFRPVTVEIAERFKFFKWNQKEQESAMDYMSELCRLAKTCNFGAYLETALWDQFACRLWDVKYQCELLCVTNLIAELALKKARAAEVVLKETEGMQAYKKEPESYPVILATSSRKTLNSVCVDNRATQLQTVSLNLLGVTLARKLDIWFGSAYLRTARKPQSKGMAETKTSDSFKTAVAIVMRVVQKSFYTLHSS